MSTLNDEQRAAHRAASARYYQKQKARRTARTARQEAPARVEFPDCTGSVAHYWEGCRCRRCDAAVSERFRGTGRELGCRDNWERC